MNKYTEKERVREEFKKGNVRKDHYNGKNSITRLAIDIKIDSEKQKTAYINFFKHLEIRPEFLIFDEAKKCMQIWWFSQQNNVVTSKKQYLKLLDNFIEYVETLGLENWKIDTGSLGDDPIYLFLEKAKSEKIIINPVFDRESFGLRGEMQIHLD